VATKDTGAAQRRKSAKAAQRRAKLLPTGRRRMFDYEIADFRVRWTGPTGKWTDVSSLTTGIGWDDSSSRVTGDVTLQRQATDTVRLEQGDRLEIRTSVGGAAFTPYLTMRVVEPAESIESGTTSAQLETELAVLDRFKQDWQFQKKGAHKAGWLAHQMAAFVCDEAGVKAISLVRGKVRQTLTKRNASATSIIVAAYARERKSSGNRFIIETRSGGVVVRTPKRGGDVPVYGPLVRTCTITRRWPKDFATILVARGRVGKRQVKITVPNRKLVERYGKILAKTSFGTASSQSLLRRRALRDLARRSMMEKEVTFTHPGVLTLRRGDQIKLEVPGYTFGQAMFVKAIQHTASAGEHEMTVTCTFTDPIPDTEGDKIKAKNSRDAKKKTGKATTPKARQRRAKAAA
jgi:hypothetical protein